jgi:hypothetical protein
MGPYIIAAAVLRRVLNAASWVCSIVAEYIWDKPGARLREGQALCFDSSGPQGTAPQDVNWVQFKELAMAETINLRVKRIHQMRDLARRLRGEQSGREWQELREAVSTLVCRLVNDNPKAYKLADHRHGIGSSILVPLTDRVAALRFDGAVFLLECISDWTPLSSTKTWQRPVSPAITMVGVDRPPGPLH